MSVSNSINQQSINNSINKSGNNSFRSPIEENILGNIYHNCVQSE